MPPHPAPSNPSLEFWFDFGSNYSYLAMMRIADLAESQGVRVELKPFLLGPIFKSLGWETSPFVLQKQKGEYTWRDMERQCAKYGVHWKRPTVFPRRALLPLRVAILGTGQSWQLEFCQRVMRLNFVEDRDIDNPISVAEILDSSGLPSADIIARANSEENKNILRRQSDEAAQRGVFGAPTFFVGGEMFWGNDRLDDALALAQSQSSR